MNHRILRGAAAALCAAALCCTAPLMLTGCGDSSSHVDYAPFVPDSKIDENVPGETINAGIGDTADYQGKLTVKLDRVVELDSYASQSSRVLLAEMHITNNTDKAIDCSTLTHFTALTNGEQTDRVTENITSEVYARRYYTKIGSDLRSYNQAIEPGQTVEGYISLMAPSSWQTLTLKYIPYKYYSNDAVLFDLEESKLTHYTESLE